MSVSVSAARAVLPSSASVRLILSVVFLSAVAHAEPISDLNERQWTQARLGVSAGLLGRMATTQFDDVPVTRLRVPKPSLFALAVTGAYFPREHFGVAADLRADMSGAQDELETRVNQQVFRGTVAAALRWNFTLLFGLEAQLGWNAGTMALLYPRLTDSLPETRRYFVTGPSLTLAVNLEPSNRFGAQLFGRLDTSLTRLSGGTLSVGASASLRFVDIGPFELGATVMLEWSQSQYGAFDAKTTQGVWRATVGPALWSRREGAAPLPKETTTAVETVSVMGLVRTTEGAPIPNAAVTVRDRSATTDETGRFSIAELKAGPAKVSATASGFKPASSDIVVTPGTPVDVTLTLAVPTGPGTITGIVTSKAGAVLPQVKVTIDGATQLTGADGSFSMQHARGPTKVAFFIEGYARAEETVLVLPETTATVNVTLEPTTQRTKAKIRGVISSAAGPVAKATVRIVELKLKQAVKPDGRFEAEVKGGKYTIVIEAPKHVTQTRVLEVADGDQAIFQIELEKAR